MWWWVIGGKICWLFGEWCRTIDIWVGGGAADISDGIPLYTFGSVKDGKFYFMFMLSDLKLIITMPT